MIPFIFLVYLIVLLFAFIEKVLNNGELIRHKKNMLYTFGKQYQTLFGENPDKEKNSNVEWLIFFFFTTILNIVAFNLLVSLVSNTFDKVLAILPAIQCKIKAEMLIEIASYSSTKKTQEEDMKYLYIAKYTSELNSENDGEWNGRVKLITSKIEAMHQ
jgi:hypothetical protein